MKKQIISILLVVLMVVSLLPTVASAETTVHTHIVNGETITFQPWIPSEHNGSKVTTKNVTTTYYLSTVDGGNKLSTSSIKAEVYQIVSGEHDYKYVNCGNGTHNKICKNCGDTVNENCVYDKGDKCICGAVNPANIDMIILAYLGQAS